MFRTTSRLEKLLCKVSFAQLFIQVLDPTKFFILLLIVPKDNDGKKNDPIHEFRSASMRKKHIIDELPTSRVFIFFTTGSRIYLSIFGTVQINKMKLWLFNSGVPRVVLISRPQTVRWSESISHFVKYRPDNKGSSGKILWNNISRYRQRVQEFFHSTIIRHLNETKVQNYLQI